MTNFSDADISGTERAFTVDDVMATPEEPWVPELTIEEQIVAAKAKALIEHANLDTLLIQAIARKEQAQEDINRLREAMIIWEPIQSRLVNGPARRQRDETPTDAHEA